MCGILGIFGLKDAEAFRKKAVDLQKMLRHRGPDWSGLYLKGNNLIAHERLAIVGPDTGDQPMYSADGSVVMGVNGEIYNYKELEQNLNESVETPYKPGGSDCEVLINLYQESGVDFLSKWEVCGMFSFILYDESTDTFVVARDPIGIIPLYRGYGRDGSIWISSEMKVLVEHCERFECFPPGHVFDSKTGETRQWFQASWWKPEGDRIPIPTEHVTTDQVREAFEASVKSHLMSDVPYGVLLSGGLDSSLVASVMNKFKPEGQTLHTFSVGLATSPDLKAARGVADYLGTTHHEYTFTVQQGIDALKDVIYHIESFDVTSIRSSTPMYLMARRIKATGVKMVLSGEGADEIFGGYLYFHKCPNKTEFHEENVRKVRQLHLYDCLRANKSMMAWGVEARVPFLDRRFLEFAMGFDPTQKMCGDVIEKKILRSAFDVPVHSGYAPCTPTIRRSTPTGESKKYLPDSVLWRQKEQFSDGVGYSWIDGIQAYADSEISDAQLANAEHRWPVKTPRTKEAYLYRELFTEHFGNGSAVDTVAWQDSIACSSAAAIKWDASFQNRGDASGRAVLGVHNDAYKNDWAIAGQDSGMEKATS